MLIGPKAGLLQTNEYSIVSTDENCNNIDDLQCNNYNYLYSYSNEKKFWSITRYTGNTFSVFVFNGGTEVVKSSYSAAIHLTVEIPGNLLFYLKGNGTEKDPYVIEYKYAD